MGRGADVIILEDILKPEDALSETRRKAANEWYFSTLLSRLNSKEHGVIIIVMQRLHQEDLVGEVTDRGPWDVLSLPAMAIDDEEYLYENVFGETSFVRKAGEAFTLNAIRSKPIGRFAKRSASTTSKANTSKAHFPARAVSLRRMGSSFTNRGSSRVILSGRFKAGTLPARSVTQMITASVQPGN